jgi:hypothetical protein
LDRHEASKTDYEDLDVLVSAAEMAVGPYAGGDIGLVCKQTWLSALIEISQKPNSL